MKAGGVILADVTTVELEADGRPAVQASAYGQAVTISVLDDVDEAHATAVRGLMLVMLELSVDEALAGVQAELVAPLPGSTTTIRRYRVTKVGAR
jgi:hypothetical protein